MTIIIILTVITAAITTMAITITLLTEGSLDRQWCGLLGFITETELVNGLDSEDIGFSGGETADHKPRETQSLCCSETNNPRHKGLCTCIQYIFISVSKPNNVN